MNKTFLIFIFLFLNAIAYGQEKKKVRFNAAIETIIATDSIKPFWSRVNKYGTVPLKGNLFAIDLALVKQYDSLYTKEKTLKRWDFGYGTRVFGGINNNESIITLPEAYLKLRWKNLEFYGGRRQEIFGLVDSFATSGSYIWSGNAMPLPKLQIHTPEYLPISKNCFLSIKAGLSHGWFADNGIVKNHWLHQKWLYGKIGRNDSKVQFSAGINHQVMWGGYSEVLKNVISEYPPTIDGYLAPYPLYSYQYVLLPFLQKLKAPDATKVPGYDGGLAIGNQLGSVDLAFDIKVGSSRLLVYLQQPYDFARSLYNLNNIEDGLYGISLKTENRFLQKICLEFFDSRSQGRYRFGKIQASNFGEVDNYFFHGQYQSWSNQGNIIGNPFIIDSYLEGADSRFNNRLSYLYTSIFGNIGSISYNVRITRSRNIGTYGKEIDLIQNSGMLQLRRGFGRYFGGGLDFSIDRGYLYPNNESVGLKAQFSI